MTSVHNIDTVSLSNTLNITLTGQATRQEIVALKTLQRAVNASEVVEIEGTEDDLDSILKDEKITLSDTLSMTLTGQATRQEIVDLQTDQRSVNASTVTEISGTIVQLNSILLNNNKFSFGNGLNITVANPGATKDQLNDLHNRTGYNGKITSAVTDHATALPVLINPNSTRHSYKVLLTETEMSADVLVDKTHGSYIVDAGSILTLTGTLAKINEAFGLFKQNPAKITGLGNEIIKLTDMPDGITTAQLNTLAEYTGVTGERTSDAAFAEFGRIDCSNVAVKGNLDLIIYPVAIPAFNEDPTKDFNKRSDIKEYLEKIKANCILMKQQRHKLNTIINA